MKIITKGEWNMNKIKKILLSLMCSLLLISCFNSTNLYAMEKYNSSAEIEDRYWAGNPNPAPGSEAWLQQYGYIAPKNVATARKCAKSALGWNAAGAALSAKVEQWLKHSVSVASFVRSFGISFALGYLQCVLTS